jgi:hypothetical protein
MLQKAAARRKPEERSIKKAVMIGQACCRKQLREGSQKKEA